MKWREKRWTIWESCIFVLELSFQIQAFLVNILWCNDIVHISISKLSMAAVVTELSRWYPTFFFSLIFLLSPSSQFSSKLSGYVNYIFNFSTQDSLSKGLFFIFFKYVNKIAPRFNILVGSHVRGFLEKVCCWPLPSYLYTAIFFQNIPWTLFVEPNFKFFDFWH